MNFTKSGDLLCKLVFDFDFCDYNFSCINKLELTVPCTEP